MIGLYAEIHDQVLSILKYQILRCTMKYFVRPFLLLIIICFVIHGFSQELEKIESDVDKKSWLVPLAEVTSINLFVNRFDRYVLQAEWADVSPNSWKYNLERGWMSDGDAFGTNFFSHPYHGSTYYNSARSLGFSYWQSIPYTLTGSLMWEYFGETEPPSEIDLNTTTLGGIYLGEMTHRLSKALLRDNKVRSNSFLRNAGAFVLNPIGQLNSWMFDDVNQSFRSSNSRKFPIRAELSTGISIPIKEISRIDANERAILHFQMLYGDIFDDNNGFKPFDAFVLRSWLDFSARKAEKRYYLNITSHAPIYRHLIKDNFTFSVSQHYDYLENQVFKIGIMAVTADLSMQQDYGSWGFLASISVGAIPFGSSNSEIVDYLNEEVDEEFYKDYVYGRGSVSKVQYILSTSKFGRLISSASYWYLDTENFVQGIETTTLGQIRYDYPLSENTGLGIEVLRYNREANYDDIPQFRNVEETYVELKAYYKMAF